MDVYNRTQPKCSPHTLYTDPIVAISNLYHMSIIARDTDVTKLANYRLLLLLFLVFLPVGVRENISSNE